ATHLTFDGDHYLLELSIGSIWPRKYTVIIDTGSNGVFIGASKAQPFVPSRSTKTTVEPFQQAFIDRSRVTG
ncbi:uncharacterized protein L969DRAFT_33898, partial [Mixia osmundae IAM 14324]|uniref:uncharacterized protein n=1 Tax=Mixia osmundae (strain CBS 9802 / IAM 14324 / JCM 22182 / KY 12970) TaxID=764103 RepID=UPI0004A5508E